MKVISFSLFGPDRLYHRGAIRNAEICADLYPGWVCRFWIGASVPADVAAELGDYDNVEVAFMQFREDWNATFWRFHSLLDDRVDAHMFRDCDSRPDTREQAAVQEWLDSGREFHFMRDHPKHGMPALAGMWGCTGKGAERIRHLLPGPNGHGPVEHYLADQFWLRDHVYPAAIDYAMVHASPASPPMDDDRRADFRDWPTPRVPGRFVGQGFNADDTLRIPEDADLV